MVETKKTTIVSTFVLQTYVYLSVAAWRPLTCEIRPLQSAKYSENINNGARSGMWEVALNSKSSVARHLGTML